MKEIIFPAVEDLGAVVIELRARVEALEAAQQPCAFTAQQVAPTDEELDELKDDYWWFDANHSKPWIPFARVVLERYGTPANTINHDHD
jgi:hypothetical protein